MMDKLFSKKIDEAGRYLRYVCLMTASFILLWALLLTFKYFSFGFNNWDLAYFNQAMWEFLHGRQFVSIFNINFFSNHANLLGIFFLPLYALFRHPLFLVYLKVIFVGLAALPIFLIAKEKLDLKWGLFFVFLYFLYPTINYGLLYEFDWECLAALFIPLIFYFYYRNKYLPFCLAALIFMTVKENMTFYIFMLGLHSLFTGKGRKWVWFSLLTSISWFIIAVFIIIPHFSLNKAYGYWGHYPVFQEGLIATVRLLFAPINRELIWELFSPLGLIIPLLGFNILLLGAPFFLQHMLSSQLQERSIYLNYYFSLTPIVFIAAIFGAGLLIKKSNNKYFSRIVKLGLIACSLLLYPNFLKFSRQYIASAPYEENLRRWGLLKKIPPDASVMGSYVFLSALSSRHNVYAFTDIYEKVHYKEAKDMQAAEYALIDFNDRFIPMYLKKNLQGYRVISYFFNSANLGVVSAINDNVLFRKGYVSDFKLFEEKENLELDYINSILIDGKIRLSIDKINRVYQKGGLIQFRFCWHCLQPMPENYEIELFLLSTNKKKSYMTRHPICYRIKATSLWKDWEFIEEKYNFLIPNLPEGQYYLKFLFFDSNKQRLALLESDYLPLSNENTILNLGVIDIKNPR